MPPPVFTAFQATVGIHSGIHGGFLDGSMGNLSEVVTGVTCHVGFSSWAFGHCVNLGVFEMFHPKKGNFGETSLYN